MACIEAKIDDLTSGGVKVDLSNVVIESTQAHGQCMNYIDHDRVIAARPCGTDYGHFNIHK